MLFHPFIAYADFESIMSKIKRTGDPNKDESYTHQLERHIPVSYTILVLDIKDEIIFHEHYCGVNCVTHFLNTLKDISEKLIIKMKEIMPMNTELDNTIDKDVCHICKKNFYPLRPAQLIIAITLELSEDKVTFIAI